MTTAKKVIKQKPLTKLQELERRVSILECALYQNYNDTDEMLGALYLIINEAEKPEFNRYQLRNALNAFRTLLIANQSLTMDCAGLEY
jgi:hypothetical protein